MGLVVGVGELLGGVFSPLVGGAAADRYTLAAPLLLQAALPLVATVLAFGLRETNPRRKESMAEVQTAETLSSGKRSSQ
jgi:hypothetical protein